MHLEFLANDQDNFLQIDKERKNWQLSAMIAKRQMIQIVNLDIYVAEMTKNPSEERDFKRKKKLQEKREKFKKDTEQEDAMTAMRKWFLRKYFIEKPDDDGRGDARVQNATYHDDLIAAGLTRPPNIALYPAGSALLTLKFRLLSPLLTRDDDPFYLFDNPVRRDHIFGVPYLAAASVKGLAFDAYQRGFPNAEIAEALDPELSPVARSMARTRQFRLQDGEGDDKGHARRLFGLADDGLKSTVDDQPEEPSQAGRLHFSPVWFPAVQYLVMNPGDAKTGLGTIPIQFEAIAPHTANNKPVEAEIQVVYFNPAGTRDSDTATVRADLARWLAAVAVWWPVLGLGAKRLAGYGAIEPVSACCQARDWTQWDSNKTFSGSASWMNLAEQIAEGA